MPLTIEIRQRTADRPEGAAAYTSSATDTPCCPSGTRIASGCCRVLQSSDANLRSPPPEGIVHVAKPSGQVGGAREHQQEWMFPRQELGNVQQRGSHFRVERVRLVEDQQQGPVSDAGLQQLLERWQGAAFEAPGNGRHQHGDLDFARAEAREPGAGRDVFGQRHQGGHPRRREEEHVKPGKGVRRLLLQPFETLSSRCRGVRTGRARCPAGCRRRARQGAPGATAARSPAPRGRAERRRSRDGRSADAEWEASPESWGGPAGGARQPMGSPCA